MADTKPRTVRAARKASSSPRRRPPMRNVSPNDLRRTFASWLKQAGVYSTVVAKSLGDTT